MTFLNFLTWKKKKKDFKIKYKDFQNNYTWFWKKEVLEILATSHNPGSKVVYYVNQSSRRRAWRAGERRGERRGFPDAAQNQFSILSSLVGLHEHMISLLPREMHSFIPDRNSCKQDLRLDDHLVSWIWICIQWT